jgi:hypothetical protein
MIHSDPGSSSEPDPTTAKVAAMDHLVACDPPATPTPSRLVVMAIVAGLVAGVVSWLIGEAVVTAFRPPYQAQNVMGQTIMKANFEDQSVADTKNAALAFAMLGGVLGAALGMAGGIARRSTKAGMGSSVVGLVLGAVLGAGTSFALLPFYFRALDKAQEDLSRDLTLPLLVHGGIWAACGLAGGAAFAIGLGAGRVRLLKAAFGGLIGAVLGAALYELIGATAFPVDKTTYPLATTWIARLLARLLVAILSGLLAAVVINMQGRRPTATRRMPGSQRSD